MRVSTPQIAWHASAPIFSCDFAPNGVLATAGGDKEIKLWRLTQDARGVEHVADLLHHSASANVARFAPSGAFLASCGDRGEIVIWRATSDSKWRAMTSLVGHRDDVMDCAWDGDDALASCSVDNVVATWRVDRGSMDKTFIAHKSYVQGICVDPLGEYVVSASADRTVRAFKRDGGNERAFAGEYHGDGLRSFFRRCAFAPDGSFVICPAGMYKREGATREGNCAYAYKRGRWDAPCARFPGGDEASCGARFNPVVFKREEDRGWTDLPYRFVFCVTSLDGVAIYDTVQTTPIAVVSAIHYAPLTDAAWSPDGLTLVITSSDGYATLIAFEEGELGERAGADAISKVARRAPPSALKANPKEREEETIRGDERVMQAPVRAKVAVGDDSMTVAPVRRIAPTPITE